MEDAGKEQAGLVELEERARGGEMIWIMKNDRVNGILWSRPFCLIVTGNGVCLLVSVCYESKERKASQ